MVPGAPMFTVQANELQVGYDAHGSGPPVILLHSATSSGREDFAAQLPLFARDFRCYLPDARGHATTPWDARLGFSTEMLVEDLGAFADALSLDTFHLLGFSMGAMTALTFATRHPERVRTLIVIGITTEREPRASVARRLMDPEWIDRNDPARAGILARRHDPYQGTDAWRNLLRGADAPALVAVGDRDPFTPVDHAWGLARSLPDGRLLVVPDCPHEVVSRRPGLFNEAAAAFYRSTEEIAGARASRTPG
jgi:pimeloyl-ACP methyl ester carboxylesterase